MSDATSSAAASAATKDEGAFTAATEPTATTAAPAATEPTATTSTEPTATGKTEPVGMAPTAEGIKDSDKAREAFLRGDVEASKMEHAKRTTAEQHGSEASEYVRSMVFGGLDGITTTFAVVAAAAGASNDWRIILILGVANLFADGFSMGFGEFISGSAELDLAIAEREREEWEVKYNLEGEKKEMRDIYEGRGFSLEEATELVDIMSKDPVRFVDAMMVDELGLMVDLDDKWGPLKNGVVMFLSFIVFGFFPLFAYLGGKGKGTDYVFGISVGVTCVGLLALGAFKGKLSLQNVPLTALKMLGQGVVAGGVSYGLGVLVDYIVEKA